MNNQLNRFRIIRYVIEEIRIEMHFFTIQFRNRLHTNTDDDRSYLIEECNRLRQRCIQFTTRYKKYFPDTFTRKEILLEVLEIFCILVSISKCMLILLKAEYTKIKKLDSYFGKLSSKIENIKSSDTLNR